MSLFHRCFSNILLVKTSCLASIYVEHLLKMGSEQKISSNLFLKNTNKKEHLEQTSGAFGIFINLMQQAEEVTRMCSYIKLCKIHRKAPVSESLFYKIVDLVYSLGSFFITACNFMEKETSTQVFFCKFFSQFSAEHRTHFRTIVSELVKIYLK